MTRAAERLLIAGIEGEKARPQGLLVRSRPRRIGGPHAEEVATADGPVWRYRKQPDTDAGEMRDTGEAEVTALRRPALARRRRGGGADASGAADAIERL